MSENRYDALMRALLSREEAKLWAPYMKALGLDDEETIKRLVRILVVHFLLDRAMTELLTVKLLGTPPKQFEQTIGVMASLEMETRIDLANASQVISDTTASKIRTVNTIRNKLAHYHPKKGWGIAHIQELSSPEAFDQCIHKALEAIDELAPVLVDKLKPLPPTVP